MKEIWRVDVSTGRISHQPVPEEYRLLGGRGLTSRMITDEVPPISEPLGPANKLVLAPGLFGGTVAPSAGRLSAGAKSPLTGGIKEANGGGLAGHKLARLGIKALVFEGSLAKTEWQYLLITDEGAAFLPATDLLGQGNYYVSQELRRRHGNKAAVISIGPAGERGYANSTIAITNLEGNPSRHMARGGLGAVLGSKRIKAVVIDEREGQSVELARPEEFRSIAAEWSVKLAGTKKVMQNMGTANLILPMNELGCLPTFNFRQGSFSEAEKICGQELQRLLEERGGKHGHPCHAGCPIRCSNVYVDKQGQYVTSGLEYETIGLLGSNCGVGSLDAIAQLDRFCDDFGLDTMELGDTIAVCMEAGLLPFGDIQGIWHLIDEIRADSTLGKVLGQGTAVAGKVLGVRRIPAVKGQGISSYDPRGLKGTGVTYATSPMGADHTAGNCLPGRGGFRPSTRGGANPHQGEGQAELSKDIQILTTVCDITGQCFFVGANEEMLDYATRLLNAGYGLNLSQEDVLNLSRKTLRTEIKFNEKAGLTTASNRLPEFFSTEELPPFNLTFDIPQNELENFWVDL